MSNNNQIEELKRRLDEVIYFEGITLSTQEKARDYFNSIASYIQYVHQNHKLESYCKKLIFISTNSEYNAILKEKTTHIITKLKDDFSYVKKIIEEKKVKIIPYEEAFPKYTGGTSDLFALSIEVGALERILNQDDKLINIDGAITNLWFIIGVLINNEQIHDSHLKEVSKIYKDIRIDYQNALDINNSSLSYYRYTDYLSLNGVWSYFYSNKEWTLEQLRFLIGFQDIIGTSTTKSILTREEIDKLEENKSSSLYNLRRFHNYLNDCLSKSSRLKKSWLLLWNYLIKPFVPLFLILLIWFILNHTGHNVKIDDISRLMSIK